ncbi:hypothetical protein [Candidatus Poriferisodalis sp.]|uniref:hypothetical protein n=1 Tax=Candidatus Poriferisodalis sp. TaxID=3101277 RepID=UPI003B017E8C
MPETSVSEGAEESPRSAVSTSTWVVFEETEPEPPRWPILDRVRVPQSDTDTKGAGFWFDPPSSARLEAEGITIDDWFAHHYVTDYVTDLCEAGFEQEDTFADDADPVDGRLSALIDVAECPDRASVAEPVSCVLIRSDGTREPCPEPDQPVLEGEGRWMVDDECAAGVHGTTHSTRQQAWQAAARDRALRTLPYGARPLGLWPEAGGPLGCGGIKYADPSSPIDEVRILPETVAVTDGTLRGLVRNWSRTLWAWEVQVHADGRTAWWPLTIQPGETAPFEMPDWHGPADPAHIAFAVTAVLSDDADLSRGFEFYSGVSPYLCPGDRVIDQGGLAHPSVGVELLPQVLDDFPPEVLNEKCLRVLDSKGAIRHRSLSSSADLGPVPSHPSMHGRLAPGLITDLRAYLARLDDSGRVTELLRLTPFNSEGYVVDLNDNVVRGEDGAELWVSESVTREYPPLNGGAGSIRLLFEDPSPDDLVIWIGGAHHAVDGGS